MLMVVNLEDMVLLILLGQLTRGLMDLVEAVLEVATPGRPAGLLGLIKEGTMYTLTGLKWIIGSMEEEEGSWIPMMMICHISSLAMLQDA